MEKDNILYRIKVLEKLIIRNLINSNKCDSEQIKSNLTPTQMQIIDYMIEHINDNVYQKDLEKVLKLRRATVSGVLQTMEKNGLIKRVISKEDTRVKKIILNESTKEVFLNNIKKLEEIEDIIKKGIDEKDLETFCKVIDIMKDNIEKSSLNIRNEEEDKC